jgi:hypothetical protein
MTRIPTIHLNGSAPANLLEPLQEAIKACRELASKLEECSPNDRDYYLQADNAGHHARNEHQGRLAAIAKVRIELITIRDGIQDQMDQVAKRKAGR